ncbi:cholecystokinin [Silurus asotus]|uniref:Cholecystokinin n=1 Tax=Silurus asotus TaxID=30991 RepID=A0AAD5FP97_SILAS|nr:cholecystokinin [Silurus asotus]
MTLSPVHHCSFLGPLLLTTADQEQPTRAAVLEILQASRLAIAICQTRSNPYTRPFFLLLKPQEENNALPSQMDSSMNAGHDANHRANLNELLARLISRKGSVRRNSMANSKASALSTNHRIKDRDYLGWMDFGRRSAEEYDYSS